ncbi:MAG: FliM/FliN family flagellar motor C-terminal domain-containing protein [Vulcanimicrobiaceae bacterium]|jgi:flagellar motor switch/type III secretory pathway protein FliN
MIRELVWTPDPNIGRIRYARFERRVPFESRLIAAIARVLESCVSDLFGGPISVDAFPPVHLDDVTWARLCDGNVTFDMTAAAGDLSIVISATAARNIVSYAFGEPPSAAEHMSAMEMRVLERFVAELADGLKLIRGGHDDAVARVGLPGVRTAYCELRIASPLGVVIGIAVDEKPPQIGPTIAAESLEDCPIECSARLSVAGLDIFTFARLTPGDVLPLETKVGPQATLNAGPDPIAAGEGGVLGDRSAFKVHELI